MCGLVGVINTTSIYRTDFDKFFKQALICDSVRGDHSTGIFSVSPSLEGKTIKKAIDPISFLDLKEVNDLLIKSNRLMMGHNRYATKGAIGDDTAHPFTHNHITLAHNGTLYGHRVLTERADFEVDSEAVCYMLSTSNNIAKSLEKLDGAFALTWYNAIDNTFSIARNQERKIFIARVIDAQGLGAYLYSSELGMLLWLSARNGIKIANPVLVPEGVILTWKLDGKAEEPTEEKFTPKEPFDYDYRSGRVIYYNSKWDQTNVSSGNTTTTATNSNKSNVNINKNAAIVKDDRGLIGRVIDACFLSWDPYNVGNPFGACIGLWDEDIEVVLGGVNKDSAPSILGATSTKVMIQGINSEGRYYCTTRLPRQAQVQINSMKELEDQLLKAEEEMLSNSKKKELGDACKNCDTPLDSSNTFLAWNNDKYCISCKDEHPFSIY